LLLGLYEGPCRHEALTSQFPNCCPDALAADVLRGQVSL